MKGQRFALAHMGLRQEGLAGTHGAKETEGMKEPGRQMLPWVMA